MPTPPRMSCHRIPPSPLLVAHVRARGEKLEPQRRIGVLSVASIVLTGLVLLPASGPAHACTLVPLLDNGARTADVCAEQPGAGLTVVDLGDDWAPRLFED